MEIQASKRTLNPPSTTRRIVEAVIGVALIVSTVYYYRNDPTSPFYWESLIIGIALIVLAILAL